MVPDDLRLLTGPTVGVVHLPVHLDWSGRAAYDLDCPGRIVDLYRTVINEAVDPADLHTYLDAATLRQLWSHIWLQAGIRRVWEDRLPELAEGATGRGDGELHQMTASVRPMATAADDAPVSMLR
ncbi:hypothetical protein [Nocardia higoensis]|uniref:hypothetical protein n=1 Tax=Nocardia higoensis TaxID=228599 RepID=UPI0002E8798C|nr:hypothetical protein [Nocardia higoensis]